MLLGLQQSKSCKMCFITKLINVKVNKVKTNYLHQTLEKNTTTTTGRTNIILKI